MMKRFAILLLLSLSAISMGDAPAELRVPLADPFILLYQQTYYAYGTRSDRGIEVYVSDDLRTWSRCPRLALDKNNSWGERWFRAPEVYRIKNKFYMYYTADEHICVATADSPLGPFVQKQHKPILEEEKCVDNTLFIDSNGKPYLYFSRFNDGLNVWVAELTADLQSIKAGSMRKCISVSQPWEEVWPRVNEAPFVLRHGDTYYMIYSANSYESQYYGIGLASSRSAWGPWEKYDQNPILQKPSGLVGTGHGSLFTDKEGQMRIAFHAHSDRQNIHPRQMLIGKVRFKAGKEKPVLTIEDHFIVPKMSKIE